jgi:hypothetical protein
MATDILRGIHLIEKIIQFKTDIIKPEFDTIDDRLRIMIYSLAGYVSYNFGKQIIITELLRTQTTQDSYYANNPDYQNKKWFSVHQFSRGCDVSLQYFTPSEINDIELFGNLHFVYNNTLKAFLIHDIGLGPHLHLQVPPSETMIVKNIP